jgi:hypothetical protein
VSAGRLLSSRIRGGKTCRFGRDLPDFHPTPSQQDMFRIAGKRSRQDEALERHEKPSLWKRLLGRERLERPGRSVHLFRSGFRRRVASGSLGAAQD